MLGGSVAYPLAAARDVLRCYRDLVHECPDELCANAGFATGPDGKPALGIAVAWCGNLDAGEKLIMPLRAAAVPLADEIGRMRYVDLQRGGDAAFPRGRRHYWKASFLRRLDDPAMDVLIDFAARCPSPHTQIGLQRMHGAAARVAPTATAFPHRHAQWDCLILSQWDTPADDERNVRWTRALHAALQPHVEAAVYVNDLGDDEAHRVRQAYGENYDRLRAVKAVYDPDNFFRGNHNVAAAS
jgi:hypothetical protein